MRCECKHKPWEHDYCAECRIAELEERVRVEQSCNYCHEYHGRGVCRELLDRNKRLRESLREVLALWQQDAAPHECDEVVQMAIALAYPPKALEEVE